MRSTAALASAEGFVNISGVALIKRMKPLLHMDELRAKNAELARAWLYAHLLFTLLVEDLAGELDAEPP